MPSNSPFRLPGPQLSHLEHGPSDERPTSRGRRGRRSRRAGRVRSVRSQRHRGPVSEGKSTARTLLRTVSPCRVLTRGEHLCFTARTGRASSARSKWLLNIRAMRLWAVTFFSVFFSLLHVFVFVFFGLLRFLFLKWAMPNQRKDNAYAPSTSVCRSAHGSARPGRRCPQTWSR